MPYSAISQPQTVGLERIFFLNSEQAQKDPLLLLVLSAITSQLVSKQALCPGARLGIHSTLLSPVKLRRSSKITLIDN